MTYTQTRTDIAIIGLTQRDNSTSFGGAPVVIVNLANHFVRCGHRVEVLIFTRKGVTEFPFPFDPEVVVHCLRSISPLRLLLLVIPHLLRSQPRAILAVGNKADMLMATASCVPGIDAPYWPALHHNLSSEMDGWDRSKRARRIRRWRRILNRAAELVCVSHGVADDFVQVTGCSAAKVAVLYNPIVTPSMRNGGFERPAHQWFQDGAPPVLLALGRLTDQKDFSTLLRAFEKVRRSTSCRLLILGEGERRAELEHLIVELGLEGSVDLPGFEPNRFRYIEHACMLVLSSVWEGLPTVLLESLALGTPIVATDCPSGPNEILAGGEFGRLVPMRNPRALADAVLDCMKDEPNPAKLKKRAMDFSVERCGDRYLARFGLARSLPSTAPGTLPQE